MANRSISFIILLFLIKFDLIDNNSFKIKYEPEEISEKLLSILNNLSNMKHFRETLDEILVPRIVGSEGHKRVRNFIINEMGNLGWQIDRDKFVDKTPLGKLKFENIIATHNPNAKKFVLLACHYDSKYMPDSEFLGATDSAVPCAMLINLATILNSYLPKNFDENSDSVSLMFVFFDGEEAFEQWGPDDSIYGARHLAKKWHDSGFLKKITVLILLDLIGTPDPKFYSFFKETEDIYVQFMNIEESLAKYDYLENYTNSGIIKYLPQRYFQTRSANMHIEDDHIPFQQLNVPILHLIPVPFPDVWHTPDDNLSVIDFGTVENINKILRAFIFQYLKCSIH